MGSHPSCIVPLAEAARAGDGLVGGKVAAGLFAEVRVRDERIAGARLARDGYLPLITSATARAQMAWRARRDSNAR